MEDVVMAAKSVPEAARVIGVAVVTLRRLLARRELGHCRVNRRVVVPDKEIQRFLAARLVPARDQASA